MKGRQSILEDYGEVPSISVKDIARPDQKYIHFWDFMELDERVHEFQAKMALAMKDLKKDMTESYKSHYTRALIQSPDQFSRHSRELGEIEYMLENPFFLAILHFALTKKMDERELRDWSITCKKRLMERRHALKEHMERDMKESESFLVR
ncbi:MAG: hypothetical protein JSW28_07960 [Thermoplasmata archaeon]|nr:MAG: hypothetical protein JSW28_07960 [Thermoplasmata archaeon]